jgi:hypothetical protein
MKPETLNASGFSRPMFLSYKFQSYMFRVYVFSDDAFLPLPMVLRTLPRRVREFVRVRCPWTGKPFA